MAIKWWKTTNQIISRLYHSLRQAFQPRVMIISKRGILWPYKTPEKKLSIIHNTARYLGQINYLHVVSKQGWHWNREKEGVEQGFLPPNHTGLWMDTWRTELKKWVIYLYLHFSTIHHDLVCKIESLQRELDEW